MKIYADDKLVYTSPAIGRKTDLVNFNADISGADYIKIVVKVMQSGTSHSESKNSLIDWFKRTKDSLSIKTPPIAAMLA